MLLESWTCGEGFSAFTTSVTPGSDVMGPNVPLEIRWIGENLRSCNPLAILENQPSLVGFNFRLLRYEWSLPLDSFHRGIFESLRGRWHDDERVVIARRSYLDNFHSDASQVGIRDRQQDGCLICNKKNIFVVNHHYFWIKIADLYFLLRL